MAQESGSWQCKSQSESKYLRTRVPISEGRKRQMSQLKQRESITHSLPFCSIQALNRLDTTCPHWWDQPSLLSPPIQMLMSSRNTLTDSSRNNVSPAIWHPLAQTSWHRKLAITSTKFLYKVCSTLIKCQEFALLYLLVINLIFHPNSISSFFPC